MKPVLVVRTGFVFALCYKKYGKMTYPVLLTRCDQYSSAAVYEKIDLMATGLGLEERVRGKRVLLKPNLISAYAQSLACTHPVIIVEVARWFLDHGAARVTVGDSPAYGSARGVAKKHGLLDVLTELQVEVVEFAKSRKIQLADGTQVGVGEAVYECDLLVNLPKVKAHNQMFVTLAVKNLFGVVKGYKKAMLHISHGDSREVFSKMLLELVEQLPPVVTFVDGIQAMHKNGPLKGEALPLNLLAASENPLALDRALMEVLELNVRSHPILKYALDNKIAGSDLNEIVFPLALPANFCDSGFLAPQELKSISFHPLKMISGRIKRLWYKVVR